MKHFCTKFGVSLPLHSGYKMCLLPLTSQNAVNTVIHYHKPRAPNTLGLMIDIIYQYWPMTCFAVLTAANAVSTLVDSVQKPWLSGGLTVTSATSSFFRPRSNRRGTSLRNIGMKSPRPSLTASRQLSPIKTEFDRKISDNITITMSPKILNFYRQMVDTIWAC